MWLLTLAGSAAVCALLAAVGVLPRGMLGAVGVAGGQGVLLATALAWSGVGQSSRGPWRPSALPVLVLAAAVALSAIWPLGAVAYAGVPLAIWRLGRGQSTPALLGRPAPAAVLAGLIIGALLGAHLLVSAMHTLGYRARIESAGALLQALAYDAGGNVLVAECFFRGALFDRLQRRWAFWPAAAVATLACVLRYVVDPLLPKSAELVVGAVFYTGLQSVASCWLLRWSGSLVPGYVSGLGFFAAYRLLKAG